MASSTLDNGKRHGDGRSPEWTGTARYDVVKRIGEGGMGVVYEAFDRERRQLVALKTLLRFSPGALYRFKQEFRTLADVAHPNLVRLYELVVSDTGPVFFTMELVRGQDFLRHAASSSPTATPPRCTSPSDFERLRSALRQLVRGVGALHSAGKLHRDIKPSNVLVTPEGRVVLLDFGVATDLVQVVDSNLFEHSMVGTVRYMAPEQATEVTPTAASDWYSIGVILYEALAGRPPFTGPDVDVLTRKNSTDPAPPSACAEGVPPDLDALCCTLLNREPEARPAALEILRRLGTEVRVSSSVAPEVERVDSPLIGRQAHLGALADAFESVRGGQLVTIRVHGGSGVGKSVLVQRFLDGLVGRGDAVALRGRAYERESVPYKALDSVIDALSRYLVRLAEQGEPAHLPQDFAALAKLFPVLLRASRMADPPAPNHAGAQSLRLRAIHAFRELLCQLAARLPLVLYIDDVQWGDVDSVELLVELVRPPFDAPVLVVLAYRQEEVRSSPFLTEMTLRWPSAADVRDLHVPPLAQVDARSLALTILSAVDCADPLLADSIARESAGSPFIVEELARSVTAGLGGTAASTGAKLRHIRLEDVVEDRLSSLSDDVRRLLEVIAVSGRPLPFQVVGDAASVYEHLDEAILALRSHRFVRTGFRDGHEVVEPIHDRICETIASRLSATNLLDHHGRLARVLEHAPGADAEAIALHWLAAGDSSRAAGFAEAAAEQAAAKFAFEQSARLFRLALQHAASSPDAQRLRGRLAEVLLLAGRHAEAAQVYLDAAEGVPAAQRLELQRAAAEQLLAAGRIEEGSEILYRVLAAVGMWAPRSPIAAVFGVLVYRVWLAIIGLRCKEREPRDISDGDRLRIDSLFTVAHCFGIVDGIRAACMQARHLILALRAGDRVQVLRALSLEVIHAAVPGKPETRRARELMTLARSLAERNGTEAGEMFLQGCSGVAHFLRGHWRQARDLLEHWATRAGYPRVSAAHARLFGVYALFWSGDVRQANRHTARLLAEAEDRGDLYSTVSLRLSQMARSKLAEDDPEGARREMQAALAAWPTTGFLVQHWQAMAFGPDIDLYAGDSGRAYELFMRDMPALKRSFLLHAGFVRVVTFYMRGKFAIGSIESHPRLRRARIAEARRMARHLERECDPWTAALASLLRAMAANAAGDPASAVCALRRAIDQAEATDSLLFIPPARHRLGELLGGDEGQRLIEASLRTMKDWGIRNPERWVSVYLPGTWRSNDQNLRTVLGG